MKISGYKNRKISTHDSDVALAYDLDMSVTNTTGEALFGVSGFVGGSDSASNSRKLEFNFKSGRVFDPEDRCVYSYQKDTNINLKGTFLPKEYDYFINNDLICTKGSKDDFKIRNFFFDSVGCEIVVNDLDVYGPTGALDLDQTISFEVFGTSGSSGSSGYGSSSSSGNSGKDDTITFSNALTFNSGIDLVGSVLSGEVVLGNHSFAFDNGSTNLAYLNDVGGGGTKKDLKLISQVDLAKRHYDLTIDFHTTFGKITKSTLLRGIKPENPSGVTLAFDIDQDGSPLNSGNLMQEFYEGPEQQNTNQDVSGIYSVVYSASEIKYPETANGLPYKVYLEHVGGDHSKQYSFVTGILLSGSGLGYTYTDSAIKTITLRTGTLDETISVTDGTAGIDGASFGTLVSDSAVGLISASPTYETKMTESFMAAIATNLNYKNGNITNGTNGIAGSDNHTIVKTNDGTLITRHSGVVDISTVIPQPNSPTASTKTLATGVPQIFNYTKPASDWKLYTGAAGTSTDDFIQQTETGSADAPLRHFKYGGADGYDFLNIVVKAKNYVDVDPMTYRLVVSGADGFLAETFITGSVMNMGPFDLDGNLDGINKYTPIHNLRTDL